MTSPLPLANSFPVFTEEDWRAAAARTKRGPGVERADPDAARPENEPLFRRRPDARPIVGRAGGRPWRMVQRIDAAEPAAAAAMIAEDIEGGATGAEVAFRGILHPLGGQLGNDSAATLAAMVATRLPAGFHLRIDGADMAAVGAFMDLAATRNVELVVAHDPIAAMAIRGDAATAIGPAGEMMRATARTFDERGIEGAVAIADGRLWHAAGAMEEQELGVTIATFVAHLRALAAPGRVGIALALDSDQYRGIAKLRAMRLLLARVAEVAGLGGAAPRIHAETAWRTMSVRDAEMNILRGTSAAFAAAAGGADSLTVLPFRAGDAHARRLALNTQTILAEEANLFRVADPGAGSGAIETLTTSFAEAAWRRFQAIEAEGGIVAAIAGGSLLREIAEVREARLAGIAAGDTTMIGVNAYTADGHEPIREKLRRAPIKRADTLIFKRLAEAFEASSP